MKTQTTQAQGQATPEGATIAPRTFTQCNICGAQATLTTLEAQAAWVVNHKCQSTEVSSPAVPKGHTPPTIGDILTQAENAVIDLRGCSRLNARTYLRGELRDRERANQ